MNLINKKYRPSTIVADFPHISKRQIAYYAEEKIVTPILDSSGPGTSRIYDFSGVLSIILALEVRNFLKKNEITMIVRDFQKKVKSGSPHKYISISKTKKGMSFEIGSIPFEPIQAINIVFNTDVLLSVYK